MSILETVTPLFFSWLWQTRFCYLQKFKKNGSRGMCTSHPDLSLRVTRLRNKHGGTNEVIFLQDWQRGWVLSLSSSAISARHCLDSSGLRPPTVSFSSEFKTDTVSVVNNKHHGHRCKKYVIVRNQYLLFFFMRRLKKVVSLCSCKHRNPSVKMWKAAHNWATRVHLTTASIFSVNIILTFLNHFLFEIIRIRGNNEVKKEPFPPFCSGQYTW